MTESHQKDVYELGQLRGTIHSTTQYDGTETDPYARTLLAVLDSIGNDESFRLTLLAARGAWTGEGA